MSIIDHGSNHNGSKLCNDPDVSWNELRKNVHCATPSVIRRGLCMVRNQGAMITQKAQHLTGARKHMSGVCMKAAESCIKYGAEIATACDPLAAAIDVGGKIGVGLSLSRFSASQCAGIVGVIVSSITPQASVPLLLKKISEDLEYLKKSLDIVRENPQYMANEFLSIALTKLESYDLEEALSNFEKAEYEATKGVHMAPTFQGVLGCVQIRVFANVMMECASSLEGIPCFVPIHCLPIAKKDKIRTIIACGLSTILKKAETRKWNGKKGISPKMQNIIDPFLASLYNTYSLSAGLTDPYQDCAIPPPQTIKLRIDVSYIPEGENDNCKLEVLLHDDREIVLFVWKEFRKGGSYAFLRKNKTTWTLDITNGFLFAIEYDVLANKMRTSAGELEKTVGWPVHRKTTSQMIDEAKEKLDCKMQNLSYKTYKWIKKVPLQYLKSMNIDLEETDKNGISLIHILAQLGDTKGMKYVLSKIRNIDIVDSFGETPLHKACAKSKFKAAHLLIEYGADVNAVTNEGDSPLTILAAQGNIDIHLFKTILDCNGRRDHENNDDMRAVDLAKGVNAKKEIIQLLRPIV